MPAAILQRSTQSVRSTMKIDTVERKTKDMPEKNVIQILRGCACKGQNVSGKGF